MLAQAPGTVSHGGFSLAPSRPAPGGLRPRGGVSRHYPTKDATSLPWGGRPARPRTTLTGTPLVKVPWKGLPASPGRDYVVPWKGLRDDLRRYRISAGRKIHTRGTFASEARGPPEALRVSRAQPARRRTPGCSADRLSRPAVSGALRSGSERATHWLCPWNELRPSLFHDRVVDGVGVVALAKHRVDLGLLASIEAVEAGIQP